MAAGDCLFMHPNTVHGSRPRAARNTAPRRAFSTRWLGDDVVYRPDALTARLTQRINGHPAMLYGEPPGDSAIPITWPPRP
jgi:ectoine hydroxylase-related dioxygenase (phytanoyl-CoA dioxygenase family)